MSIGQRLTAWAVAILTSVVIGAVVLIALLTQVITDPDKPIQVEFNGIPDASDVLPQPSGTTGFAGTGDDYSRFDHRHEGDGTGGGGTSVTPSDDDPVQSSASADPGTSAEYSRGDHRHQGDGTASIDPYTGIPQQSGTTPSTGISDDYSRGDHRHEGDGVQVASNADPEQVAVTPAAGTDDTYSRSDHVHQGLTLADTVPERSIADTGDAGALESVSRSDHVHQGDGGETWVGIRREINTAVTVVSGDSAYLVDTNYYSVLTVTVTPSHGGAEMRVRGVLTAGSRNNILNVFVRRATGTGDYTNMHGGSGGRTFICSHGASSQNSHVMLPCFFEFEFDGPDPVEDVKVNLLVAGGNVASGELSAGYTIKLNGVVSTGADRVQDPASSWLELTEFQRIDVDDDHPITVQVATAQDAP